MTDEGFKVLLDSCYLSVYTQLKVDDFTASYILVQSVWFAVYFSLCR